LRKYCWFSEESRVVDSCHIDDFDLVEGMPVGIQIVCGKYEDEKCIAVGKVVDTLMKNNCP
jgi:hypothetical protein